MRDLREPIKPFILTFLNIKVGSLKYQGEGIEDNLQPAQMTSSTLKKIFFEDVTVRTDEFSFQRGE